MVETLTEYLHPELLVSKSAEVPLPPDGSLLGWQDVEIVECNEPLVSINDHGGERIVVRPYYYRNNFAYAQEEQFVRSGVLERLQVVASGLPAGYKLVILDAWRPVELQQEIYTKFFKDLWRSYPGLSQQELHTLCKQYVSLPSTDKRCPSPHYTGGSVDLTLEDSDGFELWMGTHFDDFSEKAATRYFENPSIYLREIDLEAQRNRRFFHDRMCRVGTFTGFPNEWWHLDRDNQFWAKITGNVARYGVPARVPA